MNLTQVIGLLIFLHDLKDFPKLDRLHHWQVGAFLFWMGE